MSDWESDVGPGWRPIVKAAIALLKENSCEILQVKEKFGGLRLYYAPASERCDKIIDVAEWMCSKLCEDCGELGSLRNDLPWIRTLCDTHYSASKARQNL